MARESDISSETNPEPILALSALTMLLPIEAPSVEATRDEGATVEPSVTPSVGVQAGSIVVELQQSAIAPAIFLVKQSRV